MAKKNPATTIHIGTFRDSCASHGCSGCPSKKRSRNSHETKKGNYLLRSVHRDNLLDLMALVHVGRVNLDSFGIPAIHTANGSWAGHCGWGVEMLEKRGLIKRITHMDNVTTFELTTLGYAALSGALTALGRTLDTVALLERIDETRIY